MADNTKIEWVKGRDGEQGATWNPITGCTVHSSGCTNCYAMKLAGTRLREHPSRAGLTTQTKAGPVWNGQVRFNEDWLTQPLKWKRPRMIFVCAHADLFHESVPDEWIDRIFAVMALCPQHTFQVLTKRSARMREYLNAWHEDWSRVDAIWEQIYKLIGAGFKWPEGKEMEWPLPNVWLGVSVENQAAADERIPDLLSTPAAVRWISAEPLLGPVDLTQSIYRGDGGMTMKGFLRDKAEPDDFHYWGTKLDWIVAGGESGKDARPMHPDWARSLRDQCAAAGTPFFFKQWGEWFPYGHIDANGNQNSVTRGEKPGLWHTWPNRFPDQDDHFSVLLGKTAAGRLLDGVLHDGMPT